MLKVFLIMLLVIVANGQTTTTSFTEPKTLPTATFSPKPLDKFSHTNHLRSDALQILTPKTILIPNFHFDGNTPNAHFVAGTGLPSKTNRGTLIPLPHQEAADAPLPASYGQSLNLSLPKDITTSDIDWLAVWSDTEDKPLDFVWTKNKTIQSKFPPQTLNLFDRVKSGPVVLVDRKTLYIPNLRYENDGSLEDVHFCAGNGSDPLVLTQKCRVVKDENGSDAELRSYHGENIYLTLPEGATTDNTDFFGVYSRETSLGHVPLKGIANVPQETSKSSKIVMRVPKCCPLTSVLSERGCAEMNLEVFSPKFSIFEHNATHLNNVSLSGGNFSFEPYVNTLSCPKYPLDEEQESFGLLQNGSLIVNGNNLKTVLSQGEYCMDYVEDLEILMFVCAPEEKINQGMFKAYLALLIISTLCLIGAIIVYYVFYKHSDLHKKCFTFYALSMCVTFICQITVQVAYIEDNTGCVVIGFFFQIAMIISFTWLAVLCFDILSIILNFDEDMRTGKRFFWYIGVVLGVALISLIVSISRNLVPDVPNSFFKPQFKRNSCYFEEEKQRSIYFYVPIGLSILLSLIFLAFSKFYILKFDREKPYDYFWNDKKVTIKFLYRGYVMIFMTMLLRVVNFVAQATLTLPINVLDFIDATQGIELFLLFLMNNESKEKFKIIKSRIGQLFMNKQTKNTILLKDCSKEFQEFDGMLSEDKKEIATSEL